MNKDDFDIFRHLRKTPKTSSAVNLIRGLNDRENGHVKRYVKARENIQLFAEEQLVRKQDLNEMRCEMPGHPRSTFLMVFSPDGHRAASTHGNHNIYVTDLRNGKNIKTLVGHPRTPWCIAFHPTSDQIVASGCLGGQVRIWDLSGGSEVWTTTTQSVIASIAFHPNDRVLVIATFNEVYFWDWSQPEPFVHAATNNPKEKVRYVAFDKLGHKLITGIANSPQTRWERVRAPVPVPRQERCASPYRRRITQRLVTSAGNLPPSQPPLNLSPPPQEREPPSVVPERERRITMCYRNLVREYELLVHRYLQLYRPPTMIDRGTDPMEPSHLTSGTQTAENSSGSTAVPGPSGTRTRAHSANLQTPSNSEGGNSLSQNTTTNQAQPSTSHSQNLITPSRIFSVGRKPPSSIRGTQTSETRKHKADELSRKRFKRNDSGNPSSESGSSRESSPQAPNRPADRLSSERIASNAVDDQRVLVVNLERLSPERIPPYPSAPRDDITPYRSGTAERFRRRVVMDDVRFNEGILPSPMLGDSFMLHNPDRNGLGNNSPSGNRYSERFNEYIRSNRERIADFHRRNPVLSTEGSSDVASQDNLEGDGHLSSPTLGLDSERLELSGNVERDQSNSGPNPSNQRNVEELLSNIRRTAEEEVRNRILPIIRSVPPPDRPELIRLFENSREHVRMRFRQMCPVFLRRHGRSRALRIDSSTDSSSSDNDHDHSSSSPTRLARRNSEPNGSQQGDDVSSSASSTGATAGSSNASTSTPNVSTTTAPIRTTERNFNTELEQLVTSLLTEIERNENEGTSSNTFSQTAVSSSNNTSPASNSFLGNTTSARTRPSRGHPWSNLNSERIPQPPGESIESMIYDDYYRDQGRDDQLYRRFQADFDAASPSAPQDVSSSVPTSDPRNSYLNTSTRTTNSPVYTSNTNPTQRRRFFSHRVSAFMPTRVNYTRTRFRRNPHYTWGSGRAGIPRTYRTPSLVLDELINYAERENSEDDPPLHFHPFDPPPEFPSINPENIGIGNMYSNIVQDLESSLNDVRNIRASNRPGETSDMLSSFSERLENIMNQSDTILRNLRSSMDLLPNATEAGRAPESEPRWNFNDPGFYVRDLRNEPTASPEAVSNADSSLQDLIGSLHAVATDHTYPRNPNSSTANDNMSPLMNSLHLTISHIQRQARLLRRQVESIERIDRAMVEVAQLQLMRQLVIELVRHIRSLSGESRSTGVSSVRHMMAGTRISDSSPYESPNEEAGGSRSAQQEGNGPQVQPGTSLEATSSSDQPGSSAPNSAQQRRSTNRKTYPPSRFVRLARHYQRRPSIVHWFSRRYLNRFERGIRQNQQARSGGTRTSPGTAASNVGSQIFNYSNINSSTLSLMTRRLEHLLTDQMRIFTRPQEPPTPSRSTASVDLGEHILALRLHGCLLRMNRVLGSSIESNTLRNLRSDATAAVTQDGAPRYGARHTLSLIVDGMSRHIEELGTSNISNSMRMQIHGVLAMSLLLTELLLLQVVDSIPPPSGMNLDPERESLARRIDEMCTQMLQNRVTGGSAQLTRSLRLMRLTMRHAHRALDQTYIARRNAMMPRQDTDRRQLLGTINRCLRTINRTQGQGRTSPAANPGQGAASADSTTSPRPSTSGSPSSTNETTEAWYSTINDLITRYSDNREDDVHNQPSTSTSRDRAQNRDALSSNNDNSDDDPDDPEPDWFYHRNNNTTSHNSNLYRTNNVNLVQPSEPPNPPRPWNVPSVQVNDIPVSEPSTFQRLMSHRQRFAERVSELRSNPRVGLFRPRFLHPLYASVNPFDADLDDPQREQIYDSDMITTVTPNHRIQAWDISNWTVPSISNSMKNVVVSECKIHNDASVDIATDGTILVTLLPSGGYLNVTNRLGVYSLRWETLGQCLYTASFEQNAVSVSLSPLSRHLVVGFASRRVSIVPSDQWVMARIYKIEQTDVPGDRLPILRELEQHRESRINCIRWLPMSGQGLIYATNTGRLVILS